jgi:hypothetical protein
MAIVVLVLWLFTAGAGFYLLVTSNLGRARPADRAVAARAAAPTTPRLPAAAALPAPVPAAEPAPVPAAEPAPVPAAEPAPVPAAAAAAGATTSRREMRRAVRDRWDPPSLTAAKSAPVIPGARSLVEFAHPACAIIGLGFWLGFTLVHNRALGWIAFGLMAVTVCLGLTWFTLSSRAAKRRAGDRSAPYFARRLLVLHGSAAAITVTLAALTAFVVGR